MKEFLQSMWFMIYPLLCVYVPCMIYQAFAVRHRQYPERKVSKRHLVWTYIFMLYIAMALSVAGGGCFWDMGRYGGIIRPEEINIVPFKGGDFFNYVTNIIMFMPLGFLLPLIWKRFRNVLSVAGMGLFFSFLIETGQLFNRRVSDVNDLIMNTLGAVLGFGIWLLFNRIFKKRQVVDFSLRREEAVAYVLLAVLGKFFLYDWRFFVEKFYT